MNKFKEKKMIITGTIVAMGFLIVAITVPVVLVISNKNKSEDEKNANRKILDKEKARIDSLERFTIKKSVVEISLNSLHSSELELGQVVPGIKYVPTHKEFTKDGNYIVSIKLSISNQSVIATRKIKIEGINAFKTRMANQQAVNNVAKLFDKLKNAKDGTSSILTSKSTTLPFSLLKETLANNIGFKDPSATKRYGTNVTFKVKEYNDHIGTLVVEATISKGQVTKVLFFKLKDMQTKSQAQEDADEKIIEKEKLRIEALPRETIIESKLKVSSNSLTEFDLNLGEKTDTRIKYVITHNEFTRDDIYNVSIKLSIDDQTTTTTRKITIQGINATKNLKAVDDVVKLFKLLIESQDGTTSKLSKRLTILPSSLSRKKTASTIGFEDPSANKRNGVNVDFEIASHDDNLGTLVVKATISKGTIKKIVTFKLKDMQTQVQHFLEQEKTRIDKLPIITILKSVLNLPKNTLKISDLNLGNIDSDISYEPNHEEFTADGNYIVSITLSIGKKTVIATRKIKIEGIDAFKKKTANQKAVNYVAALFDKLKNAQAGTNSNLSNRKSTLPSSLNGKTTASAIGFEDPSANKRNGVNVDFEIDSHDDNHGTLVVRTTISKGTIKKIVTFKLKDMQTKEQATIQEIQQILSQEKTRIDKLPIMIIKKSLLIIPLNTLKPFDLYLGNTNSDIEYETTHKAFDRDDKYDVSIKLSMRNQTATATRKIQIQGINAFKTKMANQKAVDDVAKLFDKLINAQGGTSSTLAKKPTTLPSSLNGKKTASAIGFEDPSADKRNGTNVVFEIDSHDDNLGSLIVKTTISKGQANKVVSFKLKDMQTIDQKILSQEKMRIEDLGIIKINKPVSILPSNYLQKSDLDLGNLNSDIKYEPNHKEFTADGNYIVSITLSIGKKTVIATRKIKIEGIDAFKIKMANEQAVNDVVKLFDDLKNASGGTTSILKNRSTTLPFFLRGNIYPDSIGFKDPSKEDRKGTNIKFEVKEYDNVQGTLIVKATIKKGAITKDVTFKLKDMQTLEQVLNLEQTKINNTKDLQEFVEWDIFKTSTFEKQMQLLGIQTQNPFHYKWSSIETGIKIEVSVKNTKDGSVLKSTIPKREIKVKWLLKSNFQNIFTNPNIKYENATHGQDTKHKKFNELDLKMKTKSQENIKNIFVKSNVYGLPTLKSPYEVYKITVDNVKNTIVKYKVWIKNQNSPNPQYDTRTFDITYY